MAATKVPEAKEAKAKGDDQIVITPPNYQVVEVPIVGTAPYLQNRFSQKAQDLMAENMEQGGKAKSKKNRPPRDFDADFRGSQHIAAGGWHGIPAAAFRSAMIDVCRIADVVMTRAKLLLFVLADGLDSDDGTPLVKIIGKKPVMHKGPVRLKSGVPDIRARAMWPEWAAIVRVRFDADMMSATTIVNLLDRAGSAGVGEGRPFSKDSNGMGMGTFQVDREKEVVTRKL